MKKNNVVFILLLLFLSNSFACKKGDKENKVTQPPPTNCGDTAIVNKLIGEWQWVYRISLGDDNGEISYSNPTQCHCSLRLIFSNNCTIKHIINDEVYTTNFFIKYDSLRYNTYVLCTYKPNASVHNNVNDPTIESIVFSADTLILKYGRIGDMTYNFTYYIKKQ